MMGHWGALLKNAVPFVAAMVPRLRAPRNSSTSRPFSAVVVTVMSRAFAAPLCSAASAALSALTPVIASMAMAGSSES